MNDIFEYAMNFVSKEKISHFKKKRRIVEQMIFFLGTIIPVLTKQHILYLYLAAMNFLKLCPNFVGSFDWKIFIYQKLSKFCFHLSTHSVNFDLKMFYIFLVCSMIKFSHVFAKKIQFTFMGLWSRKNNKN